MTVSTGHVKGRRQLRFETLDDLRREAERVASCPGKTLGNWTVSQILDHLAKALRINFDGPEARAPWFVRRIIGPLVRNSMLNKGMTAGIAMPKQMSHFLPDADPQTEASLQEYRTQIERLKVTKPILAHAVFGPLSHEDWIRLHLRHGELHFSFIVPNES